jgi:hypothetical protein
MADDDQGRDRAPEAELITAVTREERERAELAEPIDPDADLPVVARLVVEIRSDGRRTIARGALEDRATDQRVAVEARGDSPLSLALALARSIGSLPRLGAKSALRGLLGRGGKK